MLLKMLAFRLCKIDELPQETAMPALYQIVANNLPQNLKPLTRVQVAELPEIAAPNIVFLDNENIYYLLVEKTIVSETASLSTSLQLLMAAYFNLNMEYPVHCQNTLEFLQRFVFKINPKEGSKVRKGRTLNKVISLISKIQ
ncbi:uncharacterized protein LOC134648758 isoform X3 [Cydia amplana]|uniref:uncharacterized protein LOC134647333 isoform X3 n=1 Tax=Cydia amplana TaxID=1869771 RepID=UPI002FE6BF23